MRFLNLGHPRKSLNCSKKQITRPQLSTSQSFRGHGFVEGFRTMAVRSQSSWCLVTTMVLPSFEEVNPAVRFRGFLYSMASECFLSCTDRKPNSAHMPKKQVKIGLRCPACFEIPHNADVLSVFASLVSFICGSSKKCISLTQNQKMNQTHRTCKLTHLSAIEPTVLGNSQ